MLAFVILSIVALWAQQASAGKYGTVSLYAKQTVMPVFFKVLLLHN